MPKYWAEAFSVSLSSDDSFGKAAGRFFRLRWDPQHPDSLKQSTHAHLIHLYINNYNFQKLQRRLMNVQMNEFDLSSYSCRRLTLWGFCVILLPSAIPFFCFFKRTVFFIEFCKNRSKINNWSLTRTYATHQITKLTSRLLWSFINIILQKKRCFGQY